ncbi:hypothetical protein HEP86_20100 [Streptomyces sp. RPA4-5]|nr:hypothetical protein HEP86_20100 [Streptomyces sp. RPA4-5]
MGMTERSAAAGRSRDAERARGGLRAALKGAGSTLPSPALDGVSLVGDFPRPPVDLGRGTPQRARPLAEVVRG